MRKSDQGVRKRKRECRRFGSSSGEKGKPTASRTSGGQPSVNYCTLCVDVDEQSALEGNSFKKCACDVEIPLLRRPHKLVN